MTQINTHNDLEMTMTEFTDKIKTGWFRQKYGLETDSGSRYFRLRQTHGMSDLEAQMDIFEDYIRLI